ncbi:MAG: DUF4124 domain-containing protein [Hydrogenophilales bacterium]|nr:DUF4124 domain-containing protein [Hydrogenophilales bacterium]
MKPRLFLSMVLLISVAIASPGIYKWVDEKGVTHYSETPPPSEQKAKKIEVKPPSPVSGAEGGGGEGKSWQQKEQEFQKRQAEREEARKQQEAADTAARREAKIREERCATAKHNLETLQMRTPVYRTDEKGERVYVDDRVRAAEIARMKKEIETYCKPR